MAENAKWYVVHTYSGYESAVAGAIMKNADNRNLHDRILFSRLRAGQNGVGR